MPVFNAERYLLRSVQSVIAQTFEDFEVIVVDDGSTDSSSDILAEVDDERFRIIRQENAGAGAAAHRAASEARGRWLARMDADDECHPERLERQVGLLREHSETVVVGSSYDAIDAQNEVVWRHAVLTEPDDLRDTLFASSPYAGGSLVMCANSYRAVGGYRNLAGDDYDLLARLASVGGFRAVGAVLYRWRMNPHGVGSTQHDRMAREGEVLKDRLWKIGSPARRRASDIRDRARLYLESDAELGPLLRDRYLRLMIELAVTAKRRRGFRSGAQQLASVTVHGLQGPPALAIYPWSRGALTTLSGVLRLRRFAHSS